MIEVEIPGHQTYCLEHAVCDYNGTLAQDGRLPAEVIPIIMSLAKRIKFHVVTADTFGMAGEQLKELPVKLSVLPAFNQVQAKLDYIKNLQTNRVVAIGNGHNDMLMLEHAALGICLIQAEGACIRTLQRADVVCRSAKEALELLVYPKRLIATLRR